MNELNLNPTQFDLLLHIFNLNNSFNTAIEKKKIEELDNLENIEDLVTNKYIIKEENKKCLNCESVFPITQKFCNYCNKRTNIKIQVRYILSNSFKEKILMYFKKILLKFGWESNSEKFYTQNIKKAERNIKKKLKLCFSFVELKERDYFYEEAISTRDDVHYLIFICSSASEFLQKNLIYSDVNILFIKSLDLINFNESSLKEFLNLKISKEFLRKSYFFKLTKDIEKFESIITKIMQEKDFFRIEDLFTWACIDNNLLVDYSKSKVGIDFEDIVTSLFSVYINRRTRKISGPGYPDIVTQFIDGITKVDEIVHIECKTTNLSYFDFDRKFTEKFKVQIELLKSVPEFKGKYNTIIFIAKDFSNDQLTSAKNRVKEKYSDLHVVFLNVESFANLLITAHDYQNTSEPIDYLNFFKSIEVIDNLQIKYFENKILKLKKNQDNSMEVAIKNRRSVTDAVDNF